MVAFATKKKLKTTLKTHHKTHYSAVPVWQRIHLPYLAMALFFPHRHRRSSFCQAVDLSQSSMELVRLHWCREEEFGRHSINPYLSTAPTPESFLVSQHHHQKDLSRRTSLPRVEANLLLGYLRGATLISLS